jgi:hypothetical protein
MIQAHTRSKQFQTLDKAELSEGISMSLLRVHTVILASCCATWNPTLLLRSISQTGRESKTIIPSNALGRF